MVGKCVYLAVDYCGWLWLGMTQKMFSFILSRYMCANHHIDIYFLCYPGTRIVYDRSFLLRMRNSPLTKTPPAKLSSIPDIIHEHSEAGSLPIPTSPRKSHSETGKGLFTLCA